MGCGDLMNTDRFKTCVGDFVFWNKLARRRESRGIPAGAHSFAPHMTEKGDDEIEKVQEEFSVGTLGGASGIALFGALQVLDRFPIVLNGVNEMSFFLLQIDCADTAWSSPASSVPTAQRQQLLPETLAAFVRREIWTEQITDFSSLSLFSNWRHYTRALASPWWQEAYRHHNELDPQTKSDIDRYFGNHSVGNRWSRQKNSTLGALSLSASKHLALPLN